MSAHHLVAALLLFSATAAAAPVREAWLAMPDSLCPTLGATERQRMLAVAEGVYDGAVETLAGEAARIDTVAADYLRATVAGTMRIELLRLPAEGDSVLCVVKTVAGVPAGAEVVLADQQWRSVARFAPPAYPLSAEAARVVRPLLLTLAVQPADQTLTLTPDLRLLTRDEQDRVGAALRPMTLRWDGKTFAL